MQSLKDIILAGNGGVISLVGAGGKTSLMFRLAREIVAGGASVLTTTTTKIMHPEKNQSPIVIFADTAATLIEKTHGLIETDPHVTAASSSYYEGRKLIGFDPALIDELNRYERFTWIVVEADGAARRWVKAPAAHEPVIPESTDRVIGVVGLKAIGKPLTDKWVFRPELYSKLTGLASGMPVTAASVAESILNPEGILKGAPHKAKKYVYLNLAGDMQLLNQGRELSRGLCQDRRFQNFEGVIIGHARNHPFYLQPSVE